MANSHKDIRYVGEFPREERKEKKGYTRKQKSFYSVYKHDFLRKGHILGVGETAQVEDSCLTSIFKLVPVPQNENTHIQGGGFILVVRLAKSYYLCDLVSSPIKLA